MFIPSHLNKALHCPLTYRAFCNRTPFNTNAKIEELKEKIILAGKDLKELGVDASIEFRVLSIKGQTEIISDAAKKKIETEQLKRIGKAVGKAVLQTSALASFGILCAGAGAVGLTYYVFSGR